MRKPLKISRISVQGFYASPKQLKMGTFDRAFVIGERPYGLVAISPRKTQISAIADVDILLSDDAKVNKPTWAWHAVRRCVSK